ncbi:MAG: GxxExxY protein [Marinilabiliaceae bacterium]|nr:GxxExxY protein [Marinilabiliaceae bacterium]
MNIHYKGQILKKHYIADFICYENVVIELKALSDLTSDHEAQLFNYLKATGINIGLLINFGEKSLKYKRITTHSYF